ncbi:unnamed protein product [Spirodela intermedia]|uniref:DEUBAD domain-containing protein n=1 Tax=Spirodela intermedia TaxID=51605 RepID=A0A7I8IBX6_SPIIN|nr:unnamed protein product [Spirodela intermedia]CAA6654843.1 unnamed protein product [Spirodela intermedia]
MAIAHNIHRASGLDSEITPRGRDGVCSDDVIDEFQAHSLESQGTDISEVDSGMGSDDYDLLELGEASSDYCRVGSQCCLIPFELYDLPDLSSILSVETWNDCLTEEERFALTEYLPDMEQEMFSLTIRELLSGGNFHFGRPLHGLFEKLKGGLCEPKVDLYCRCMNFLQMRKHYHHLHEYQKCMVDSLVCMRNAWENYSGYGVEERLRHLNMLKSQRALGYTKNKRPKVGQWDINPMKPSLGMQSSTAFVASEQIRKGESYPRGILKVSHMNASSRREFTGPPSRFFSLSQELEPDCRPLPSPLPHPSQDPVTGFELKSTGTSRSLKRDADVGVECGMAIQPGRRVAISRLKKRSMKVEHLKRNVQHAIAEEDREGNSYDQSEEETSSEAWGIPQKTLVKLVDAFANWLKSKQEVLKKIANLPPPPIMMLPYLDEKERLRDLRAQKSLVTINPNSDEVRAFFQAEEILRYSIPDKAFSYTAIDGRKSIVAPLRRGSGKPISKARGHFMLKPDRPPHITVLCLVRDAAARLPGSIGTRLDICTLIRDSQYLVEHVSDAQVNSVVSGALDRLHYEQDPCVQFDGDRKLWKAKWTRKDSREHAGTRMTTDGSFSDIGDLEAVDS